MNHKAGLVVIATFSFAFLSACGTGEASLSNVPEAPAASPLPVEIASPLVADIYATHDTTAKIGADAEAPVVSRAEGQIVEILVEEGDSVSAGQLLARLDGDRARLQMLQAQVNLEKATREHERQISLSNRGLVSVASLEALKYDMQSLQATYELRKLNYEYTLIRAPIAGVIASRDIKNGAHVKVNDTVFTISNTGTLVAYLKIPQTELGKISAGQKANLRVDSMPGEVYEANIARISPTIDARNGTFRATAYIDNSGRDLAPGMFGRFIISYEKHADALLVPKSAVVQEDNENVIYVVEDGAAVRRHVETGIESGTMIEILGGLAAADQVVVTGQTGLRDGSRVLASASLTDPAIG
jgi:membrane fusion protein (multidrug efflux system)